ncbi:MAG: tRNA (adenosine(37)-N6)-threonylcarbamoyltransferase complex ATPase subunit type 1 TsaE, partial [Candidatus Omnitrophota bacterium]
MNKFYTYSAEETIDLGRKFSHNLKAKDVVVLEGALGSGKTTFIKGVLIGLGIKHKVLSPTFTLIREYFNSKLHVYHMDLYRIKESNIFELGTDDFLYAKSNIALIEWGEKIENCLSSYIKIEFSMLGENKRKIDFSIKGHPG